MQAKFRLDLHDKLQ